MSTHQYFLSSSQGRILEYFYDNIDFKYVLDEFMLLFSFKEPCFYKYLNLLFRIFNITNPSSWNPTAILILSCKNWQCVLLERDHCSFIFLNSGRWFFGNLFFTYFYIIIRRFCIRFHLQSSAHPVAQLLS